MAIKVGGTTVIDDSRALTNIASVDATTVAALGTAGVGGGGGSTRDFVASGTIPNGDVVRLNSNGTVSVTQGVDSIGEPQEVTGLGNSGIQRRNAVFDSTTSQIIVTYKDPDVGGGQGQYIVGKVTGQSIAWSPPITYAGLVIYDNFVEFGPAGTVLFYVVHGSGTVIYIYAINSNQTLAYKHSIGVTATGIDPTHGRAELAYNTTDRYAYCFFTDTNSTRVHSISVGASPNYTLSQSAAAYMPVYNRGAYTTNLRVTYDPTANKAYATWYDSNDIGQHIVNVTAGTGASAGQGISCGTDLIYAATSGINTHDVIYSGAAQKTFLIYRATGNALLLKTVTSSGGTTNLSSSSTIDSGSTSSGNAIGYSFQLDTDYNSSTGEVILSSRNPQANNYGYSWTIGWSSNSPVISSPFNWLADNVRDYQKITVGPGDSVIHVYMSLDSNWKLFGTVHDQAAITSAYGIANASVTNGQTVEVISLGSIVDNQSGLTIGAKYYYNADGAISTAGSQEVGVAVSATELLITGVVA
jgi:hypothetical protein